MYSLRCQHADSIYLHIAKWSYPSPKVRGSDGECQAATTQERPPRGASPRARSGAAAERSYLTPEVRGPAGEELLHLQGVVAAQAQEGRERSYSTFKVRRGSHEKIPLVQGKKQRLRFAGAAVKRYPTSKAR